MKKITYLLSLLIAPMMLLAQNQPPVAVNDTIDPLFGQEFTVNVLANDYDPDGDSFKIFNQNSLLTLPDIIAVTDSTITFYLNYHSLWTQFVYLLEDEYGNLSFSNAAKVIFLTENEKYIDINNIKAMINSFGNQFWDFEQTQFEFPKGSGKSPIFMNSLWIGGMDEQGDLHIAAETYRQNGMDFWEGPISQGDEPTVSSEVAGSWSKIWKINKEQVLYHKAHWNDFGYIMPEVIATWPAHGDPELNQAENIAPFVNIGGDEHYQPELGDYPLLKGDQTLFFVFNDLLQHSDTGGDSLGIEVHGMFWAISDESRPWYDNTIFMHYEIFNRSGNDYSDTYMGIYTDTDIGYAFDDFVQSDVERGTFIGYNGDADDNGGPQSYGVNPPSVGVVILGGAKMDADGEDNAAGECDEGINGAGFGDGIVDNERMGMSSFVFFINGAGGIMGDPSNQEEYYNYLSGKWKDGSSMFFGGNGYDNGIAQPPVACRFMYPADSDPCYWGTEGVDPQYGGSWTEEYVGNVPGDRRGLPVTGPFSFNSGSKEVLDVAYVCAWDSISPYPASNDLLKVYIDSLRADFLANPDDFGYDPTLAVEEHKAGVLDLAVFPNPAQNTIYLNLEESMKGELEIYDISGRLVMKEKIDTQKTRLINVKALLPGFYTVRFVDEEEMFVGKFIKL